MRPSRTIPRERSPRRIALWLVGLLLVLDVAYLLAANLLLSSAWLRQRVDAAGDLRVEWGRAWTPWPGRVHLSNLTVRRGGRGGWSIELDRGTLSVSLLPLASRRFEARGLRGSGCSLVFSEEGAEGTVPAVARRQPRWPPIGQAGLVPATGPPGAGRRRPWALSFDRIHVDRVRELRLRSAALAGSGEIGGALRLVVGEELEVRDGWMRWRNAAFTAAGRTLVDDLDLEARGISLAPFDPGDRRGWGLAALASARLELSGRARLGELAFGGAPPPLAGEGRMAGTLNVERGAIAGRVTVRADGVAWRAGERSAAGDLEVELVLGGAPEKPPAVSLGGSRISLSKWSQAGAEPVADGERFDARVAVERGSWSPLRADRLMAELHLEMSDAALPLLLLLQDHGPALWLLDLLLPGRVAGRFALEVAHDEIRLEGLRLTGEALEASGRLLLPRGGGGGLDAELEARGRLGEAGSLIAHLRDLPLLEGIRGEAAVSGRLEIRDGRIAPGSAAELQSERLVADLVDYEAAGRAVIAARVADGDRGPVGEIDLFLQEAELRRAGAAAPHLAGARLTLHASEFEAVDGVGPAAVVTLDLTGARIPDLRAYNLYLPAGSGVSFTGGSGRLDTQLVATGPSARGRIRLASGDFEALLHDTPMAGELLLDVRLEDGDLRTRSFDLDGTTLSLDRVSLAGDPEGTAGWWARLRLPRGQVTWGAPLLTSGELELHLRDSRPLFALFAPQPFKGVRWLDRALSGEQVRGSTAFRIADGLTLDDLVVEGGGLTLRGRFRRASGREDGALYASLGPLAVGLEIVDGRRDWKLVGARRWFEAQPQFPEP